MSGKFLAVEAGSVDELMDVLSVPSVKAETTPPAQPAPSLEEMLVKTQRALFAAEQEAERAKAALAPLTAQKEAAQADVHQLKTLLAEPYNRMTVALGGSPATPEALAALSVSLMAADYSTKLVQFSEKFPTGQQSSPVADPPKITPSAGNPSEAAYLLRRAQLTLPTTKKEQGRG